MKKLLFLILPLLFLSTFAKAYNPPLPGTRWQLYDSLNYKVAKNLTNLQSWTFQVGQMTTHLDNGTSVTVEINTPQQPNSFQIRYGYDSVLNSGGTSFASGTTIWQFFQAPTSQKVMIVPSTESL